MIVDKIKKRELPTKEEAENKKRSRYSGINGEKKRFGET